MVKKDPAVLFYIANWLTETKGMKSNAKGWYLNLILFQHELGDLPNDLEELANLADVRFSEYDLFKQVFEQVLKHKFKENSNGRLENEEAKQIIQNRKAFKEKRSNAGKNSYLSRFLNKHFQLNRDEIQFIKENINLNEFDLKNEQVFKQVIKQMLELYINRNINIDISKNSKGGVGENEKKQATNDIVIGLNSDKVEIFNEWLDYRKSIRHTIKNEKTLKGLVKKFNNHTLEEIRFVMDWSINNGYQGLFWDRINKKSKNFSKIDQDGESKINRQSATTIAKNASGWRRS